MPIVLKIAMANEIIKQNEETKKNKKRHTKTKVRLLLLSIEDCNDDILICSIQQFTFTAE